MIVKKMILVDDKVYSDFKQLANKKAMKITVYAGQVLKDEVQKNAHLLGDQK